MLSLPSASHRRRVSTRTPSIEAASPIRYISVIRPLRLQVFLAQSPPKPSDQMRELTSDRETDVQDVALADDVVLPLDSHVARRLRLLHRPGCDELFVGHDLGADESPLEIGVDHTGGFGRRRTAADLPCPRLVLPGCEERDEVERAITSRDHALETRLGDAELLEQRPRLIGVHLRG